ncbi:MULTISPECIES: porin [unclassified Thioalkalivibrio]|uniref:porin n=1 Tax=unclassified Thioalkalivibrio TaxID=2621013 RepID=UPI000374144A|nr:MULTISPECIES: porin [unclassified Thioalkalivibrio]
MKKTMSWTLAPLSGAVALALFLGPHAAFAQQEGAGGVEFDFYGSLRLQYEAADPEGFDSYDGFRDAYSRMGFNANYEINEGVNAFAQLEVPIDLANGKIQDPFNGEDEDIRIGKIGLDGAFGTVAYGRDWMPYYNAIAFPVDMFYSYQSGFATYTTFRESDSVMYYSPDFDGFSFAGAYSANSGADGDDRYQLTGSYAVDDTTLSIGVDDLNGENNQRIWGLSAMHSMGPLSLAAKVEYIESDNNAVDGDVAANIYAAYRMGQHTFHGTYANVDNYGENIYHLGYAFNWMDGLTLFAEYYYEEESTGAVPEFKARDTGTDPIGFGTGDGSNNAFMVGMHYSF